MGREIRKVPANWIHPVNGKYADGSIRHIALHEGFSDSLANWLEEKAAWDRGEFPDYASDESKKMTYEEWSGECPKAEAYMPEWPEEEKTHMMMYETTSEGTPISPAFEKPEDLAMWLYVNGASAFGSDTASYESWLRVCNRAYAPSAVIVDGKLKSGVEAA